MSVKVLVEGRVPPMVKKDAHDIILDFIRSRPPLKPVSLKIFFNSNSEDCAQIQCCGSRGYFTLTDDN